MFKVKSKLSPMDLMKNAVDSKNKELEDKVMSRNKKERLLTKAYKHYNKINHHVKMLSVIDVNDSKCLAKGTSLSKQYERYPIQINTTRNLPSIGNADTDIITRLKEIENVSKNIKYRPKQLSYHELFLKEPSLIEKDLILKHPFMKKLPHLTINEIRKKNHCSHIFNTQIDHSQTEEYLLVARSPNHYKESDVFCLKENTNVFPRRYPPYSLVQQSGSEWISSNPLPSFMNYSSIKWNPLNANMANVAMTKENIINKGLRTELNIFHRQKGISEFIDLTRIGATRVNKSMQDWLDQTKGDFKKTKGICSDHGNAYKSYQGIFCKPFTKNSS